MFISPLSISLLAIRFVARPLLKILRGSSLTQLTLLSLSPPIFLDSKVSISWLDQKVSCSWFTVGITIWRLRPLLPKGVRNKESKSSDNLVFNSIYFVLALASYNFNWWSRNPNQLRVSASNNNNDKRKVSIEFLCDIFSASAYMALHNKLCGAVAGSLKAGRFAFGEPEPLHASLATSLRSW